MAALYIVERFRVCDRPLINKKLETVVKTHLKKVLKGYNLVSIEAENPTAYNLRVTDADGMNEVWKLELMQSEFDELEVMCSYEYSLIG